MLIQQKGALPSLVIQQVFTACLLDDCVSGTVWREGGDRVMQGTRQTKAQHSKSCFPAEGQRTDKMTPMRLTSYETCHQEQKGDNGDRDGPRGGRETFDERGDQKSHSFKI